MDERHLNLVAAIRREPIRPRMNSIAGAWEALNRGSRGGLNDALLLLIDEGLIQGEVRADERTGRRRVLGILNVNQEVEPMEKIAKDRTVFVVHGRDKELRRSMFEFLRAVNLRPLEWTELTANAKSASPYIGELLEQAFERAQAVVVLLTPDEQVQLVARLGGGEDGFQARPNVIFEAGAAFARNQTRTVLVEIGKLRPISDIAGRHTIRLDDTDGKDTAARQDLAARLRAAGCDVSLDGIDWHTAGTFKV